MASKQWDIVRLFERINKTRIPKKSILRESIDTLRDTNLEASIAIGEGRNPNDPMEKIVDFFSHYKIDVMKLDPNVLRLVYSKWEEEAAYEGLSDMEENPDGTLHVELDSPYGRHWMKFDNDAEFQKYYQDHILADARQEFEELYKKYEAVDRKKRDQQAYEKTTTNTLGNTHGDILTSLKSKMSEAGGTRMVAAKDLKAGDHIVGLGKGLKVVRGAQAGISTPSGKIDIVVEYPNGQKHLKIWNKNTMIQIYDSSPSL